MSRLIKEKTYNRHIKRLSKLMDMNPQPHTKNGRELLRLAKLCETYELVHWPIDHGKRKIPGNLSKQLMRKK